MARTSAGTQDAESNGPTLTAAKAGSPYIAKAEISKLNAVICDEARNHRRVIWPAKHWWQRQRIGGTGKLVEDVGGRIKVPRFIPNLRLGGVTDRGRSDHATRYRNR